MKAYSPKELRERIEQVGAWRVHLVSYRLGDEFICIADNVDPGAVLARTVGATRETAEAEALEMARSQLVTTRILR